MICAMAVRQVHKLLDDAERKMDEATWLGNKAALEAREAYAAAGQSQQRRLNTMQQAAPAANPAPAPAPTGACARIVNGNLRIYDGK